MTPFYETYTIREFVTDPAFIAWVKRPDAAADAFWQAWLAQHPHKQADVQQARLLVAQFAQQRDVTTQRELDQDWQAIQARIRQPAERAQPTVIRPLWQRQWGWGAAAAATVLLVLGIGLWTRLKPGNSPAGQPIARQSARLDVVNRTKQVVAQRLPDGSVVWMTPGAWLSYPRQFATAERTVDFTGEAFFDVAKDAARPFTIRSGQLTTRVLGTSFNVKADAGSSAYAVSVVTGKVSVTAPQKNGTMQTVLLQPKQQAVFALAGQTLAAVDVPTKTTKQEAWQPVSLSFDDATLGEVANRLEQTFNTRVSLANPALATCRLTVDFNQQRLAEILEQIDMLLTIQYTLDGNRVVLTGEGCQPQ